MSSTFDIDRSDERLHKFIHINKENRIGLVDTKVGGNLEVTGNLTVNGITTSLSTDNTAMKDILIELGHGTVGTPSNTRDLGFIFERGDSSNLFFGWDEGIDKFVFGQTTATGETVGDVSLTSTSTIVANFETGSEGIKFDNNAIIKSSDSNTLRIYNVTNTSISTNVTIDGTLSREGSSTNLDLNLAGKGNGNIIFTSESNKLLKFDISNKSNAGTLTLDLENVTGSKTIKFPDTDGLLSTNTSTETLSNKTLTSPKFINNGFIADANGAELVVFGTTDSALNEIKITNAATGNGPIIKAQGSEANIDLNLESSGIGNLIYTANSSKKLIFSLVGSGFNTTNTFTFQSTADRNYLFPNSGGVVCCANNNMSLRNKTLVAPKFSNNGFIADSNGNEALSFVTTSNAVNFLKITPSATGNSVEISADGADDNVSLNLASKGNGIISINGGSIISSGNTATLSNKTFTLPKFNDSSSDHTYNLTVSELTANRNINFPLLTQNDEFTFNFHPQNLSNKTFLTSTKIANTSNDNVGGILTISNERGSNNGIDNDVAGTLIFKTNDNAQNHQEFVKLIASANDVTSNSESGKLTFQVATTTSGALADVITITGGVNAATSSTTILSKLIASSSLDVTGSDGIILENDETITNSVNGTVLINGEVASGDGISSGIFKSNGNYDVILKTGNSTTGSITITDGTDGNIDITPNGTGEVNISKVDIDGGAIDGTTIGSNSESTGKFTTLESTQDATIGGDLTVSGSDIILGKGSNTSILTEATTAGTAGKSLTISSGSTTAGTADINGGNLILKSGAGTGIGVGGNIIFQVANAAGSSATTLNAHATALTISDDKSATFAGELVVTGNLTVNGTTTTVNTNNTVVKDSLIELSNGTSSASNDAGIIIERGSTGDNVFIGWDESEDKFKVGTTTATGSSTGDLTITTGSLIANLEGTVGTNNATTGAFTTITASTSIDITGSAGLILENDETITNSVDGTVLINGEVAAGSGSATGIFKSNGDYDVTLKTGNSTTGSITITDGADGNIDITPNGTGEVNISKVDIDGGAIDGTAIGSNSKSTGGFTTIVATTSVDITGSAGLILENDETITNSVDGTVLINGEVAAGTGSATGIFKSNGNYDVTLKTGNSTTGSITITDGTDGNINITPNGTGEVNISKVDIDGGAIDGTSIGSSSESTGKFTTLESTQNTTIGGDLTVTGSDILLGNGSNATILTEATAAGTAGKSLTLSSGSTTAGTADIDGGSLTIKSGAGTGTGSGGNILFQVANAAGSTATTLNAHATALTISDDKSATFAGAVVVTGNFTVNGTTTTISTDNTVIKDSLIELSNGASSASNDAGLIIERGSTGNNAFIGWDESEDKFKVGTTTATGASTGNLTITTGSLIANLEGTVGTNNATTGAFTTITASTSLDITGSTGLILENDETITNSVNGTVLINGEVAAGTGSGSGIFKSNGDYDVILKTGNSTTGSITITDGADGNIDITPNGTGEVNISKVDIDGGAIDGTAIGGSSKSTGGFTTIVANTSVDITGSAGLILENDETVTNSVNGTVLINGEVAAGTGSATGIFKSNGDYDLTLKTGNSTTSSITITDGANGNISLDTNGSGVVEIGSSGQTAILQSNGDFDLKLQTGNSTTGNITITDGANGDINLTPNGSGIVVSSLAAKIVNSTNDANGGILTISNERGSNNGADNDVAGSLVFKTNDAAQNNQDFAKIIGSAPDVTSDSESGKLDLQVATTTSGALASILTITGGANASTSTTAITGKLTVAGDTSSGDVAAIGYTSTEGLILTGQGSTNDITIKNDADTIVLSVATGTTDSTFSGTVTATTSSKITNTSNNSTGGILTIANERGSNNGVDDDVAGSIVFKTNDGAQNNQDFVKMIASAAAVATGSESGKLDLQVATTGSGALASIMTITGGANAAGSTSAFLGPVTVAGGLTSTDTAKVANTSNDATGGILTISNERGTNNGVDNDVAGSIVFKTNDDAQNNQDFAKVIGSAAAAASGSESGKLDLQVATTTNGSLASIMTITGGANAAGSTSAFTGSITVAGGLDITGSAGITLENDETITNSTNGTVLIDGSILKTGAGDADATIASNGNYNLILQTGNSTTGNITITDGTNGDILLTPNGTGVVVSSYAAKVTNSTNDANGGILTISNERGSNNGSDDDVAGSIVFKTNDAAQNNQDFVKMIATAASATSGSESGKLDLQVATTGSGALESIMTIVGGANAAGSTTTFNGPVSFGGGTNTTSSKVANTTNDANGGILTISNERGSNNGVDDDVAGSIVFKTNDAAQNNQDFAKVIASAAATTSGSESGKLDLQVATTATGALASVMTITGGSNASGSVTAITGKLTVAGDTASGDTAAIGYASTDGLVLTGQGSTSDVTIKNDSDGTVFSVPTGTTTGTFAGDIIVSGGDISIGAAAVDGNITGITAAADQNGRSLTITAGSAKAGDSNNTGNGGNLILTGGAGKGTAIGGSILFKSATASASNSSNLNTIDDTILTLASDLSSTFAGTISVVTSAKIANTSNNSTGGILTISNERGSNNGVDNDVAGSIVFKTNDDGQNNQDFAKLIVSAAAAASGSESGKLVFQVATTGSGSLADIITITGGAAASTSTTAISGKLTVAGDTSSGDDAAIGYTSTEGLVLTGQGSTNDITIKNDADTTVLSVATGTTTTALAGNLTVSGAALTHSATTAVTTIKDTNGTGSASTGGNLILAMDDGAACGSGHRLGVIEFKGAEDSSNTLTTGAKIEAITDAAWSGTENGTSLKFLTTDADASESVVLTLDSNKLATFTGGIDITAAAGITLENDETITNSTNGTVLINGGILATGAGDADATIASNGNHNLILQTGNSTTGSITITDGANGDITLAPNGSGTVVASTLAKVSNTANDAVGGILTLSNEKGSNDGADNDIAGSIVFRTNDDAQNNQDFAKLIASAAAAASGSESGKLDFQVATTGSGALASVMTITGGAAAATSTAAFIGSVSVAVDLDIEGDIDMATGKKITFVDDNQHITGNATGITIETDDTLTLNADTSATFNTPSMIQSASSAVTTIKDTNGTGSATTGGNLILAMDDGAACGNGHRLGVIEFKGAEDGSNTLTTGAKIEAITDAAWSATENGTSLKFFTTDADASQSVALTLDSNNLATFAGGIDVTAAAGITLENDETIKNSTNGTISMGCTILESGPGNGDATIASNGDHNLILKTGNSTTGSITITDGSNGDITLAPNGIGSVIATYAAKVANTANDTAGGILTISNERGSNNGADDDVAGSIVFKTNDDAQNNQDFAKLIASAAAAASGSESGKLDFQVATTGSGALASVMTITGGAAAATSTAAFIGSVSVAVDLDIEGDIDMATGKKITFVDDNQHITGNATGITIETDDTLTLNADTSATFNTPSMIQSASSAVTTIKDTNGTGSASTGGNLVLAMDDGAACGSGHRLGVIEFKGAEDGSNTLTTGARIEAITDAAWSGTENGASLKFFTTDADASQSVVLTLDSDNLATFAGDIIVTGSDITLGNGANGTITSQAVTGTDTAGKNLTISAGNGTGTGGSGDIIFRTAPVAGSSGNSANTLAAMLTVGKTAVTVASDLNVNGDTTTFTSSNSDDPQIIIKNTNADANGSLLKFFKDSSSPANGDVLGLIKFTGDDAGNAETDFVKIIGTSNAVTAGSESGKLDIQVATTGSGAIASVMTITGGANAAGSTTAFLGSVNIGGGIDITGSTGITLENDETITNSTNGTVLINGSVLEIGPGDSDSTIQSNGDYDLILQTGNSTTSKIKITDGSNGNITLDTNGSGSVIVGNGSAAGVISSNGNFDLTLQTGNSTTGSITLTDGSDGDITLAPNGTGVVLIDATLSVGPGDAAGEIKSNGNFDLTLKTGNSTTGLITITDGADGNIDITPNGTGEVNISKVDIDGGAIDNTVIGGNTQAAGSFTTIVATTSIDITGSTGLILENDETITNSTNGTVVISGQVAAGSGSGSGIFKSNGNHDVILKTGNSNTGSITITDGSTGEIAFTPEGTGNSRGIVSLNSQTLRVGTGQGNTTISGNAAYDLILNTNNGNNSGSITITDGTNGDITLAPNGTGTVVASKLAKVSNTANDAVGGILTLSNERGSNAGQNNDIAGTIIFKNNDNANNNQDFAKVIASAQAVTSGSESGKLDFQVATTSSGALESVLNITGGSNAASSTTTLSGKLTVGGDTSSGDTAAVGYASADGLVLTGQGSTSDVTIKNDNDANVFTVPTGTTTGSFAGDVSIDGELTKYKSKTISGSSNGDSFNATHSGSTILVTGASPSSNMVLNLPTSADGIVYTFIYIGTAGEGFQISPDSSCKIMGSIINESGNVVTASNNGGGTANKDLELGGNSKVGDRVTLLGLGSNQWMIINGVGNWGFEP